MILPTFRLKDFIIKEPASEPYESLYVHILHREARPR